MHELERRWPTPKENPYLRGQLLTQHEVEQRLDLLAIEIYRDHGHKDPLVVAIQNGGEYIKSRLEQTWQKNFPQFDPQISEVQTQRHYDNPDEPVEFVLDLPSPVQVEGRTVILTEDILDSGLSLRKLVQHFYDRGAAEVIIAVVLMRDGVERQDDIPEAHYIGFTTTGDSFYIGSGLDDKRLKQGDAEFLPSGLPNDGGRSYPGIWANRPPENI